MTTITIQSEGLKFTKSLTTSIAKTGTRKSGSYIVLDSHPDVAIFLGAGSTAAMLGLKKNMEVILTPKSTPGTYTLTPKTVAKLASPKPEAAQKTASASVSVSAPKPAKAKKTDSKPTGVVETVKKAVKSAAKKVKGDSPINVAKITNRLE